MTAEELIEELKRYPGNTIIKIYCDEILERVGFDMGGKCREEDFIYITNDGQE